MTAYYNEIDPYAGEWLRNLIKAGHIADGVVDTRSIEDVRPEEIRDFTQCHFFAGIGVWSYALRRAGWADDRNVWTGSCPCQPFSAAGRGDGFADQRHLWPAWFHLIRECRPECVFGEQVASAIGHGWLDLVSADLEAEDYAIGCAVLGAHSVGAPSIGNRLFFVAAPNGARCARERPAQSNEWKRHPFVLGDFATSHGSDGRKRPVDSRPYSLGYGVSSRVAFNRAYGNAIVPQTAAAFIRAFVESGENVRAAA